VRAYLLDRLVTQAWTLAEVARELGAASATTRRLVDHYQIRRVGPTRRQQAQAAQNPGPTRLAQVSGQRRVARLAELGFADLDSYLHDRWVRQGSSVRRMCAELKVGHGWVEKQLDRLQLRP
jgi:hypothetical protein